MMVMKQAGESGLLQHLRQFFSKDQPPYSSNNQSMMSDGGSIKDEFKREFDDESFQCEDPNPQRICSLEHTKVCNVVRKYCVPIY